MKKAFSLIVIVMFVMGIAAPLYAADLPRPVEKITHGTLDVLQSPVVLFDHTKSEVVEADHKIVGLFTGLLTAPFHMIKKAGTGVLDIVTFPIE